MGSPLGGGTPVSPTAPEEEDDRTDLSEGGGFFGLFDNALKDVGDIASGAWKLGGMVTGDIVRRVGDVADLDIENDADDYVIDDIWGSLTGTGEYTEQGSAIWNDYQERYGPIARGDLAGHVNEMYKSPLSFISDALMVAGGAGALAKGTVTAGRAGGLISKATGSLDDVSRLGKVVRAIEGNARRLGDPMTGKVNVVSATPNPVRRALFQNTWEKMISRPVSPYERARINMVGDVAENYGPDAAKFLNRSHRYQQNLDDAIRAGADRIYRDSYSRFRGRKFVDRVVGTAMGTNSHIADTVMDSIDRNFANIDPKLVSDEDIVRASQGTDTLKTDDGIIAPGTFDPHSGAMAGYRRAEIFPERGQPSINNGPTRWGGDEVVEGEPRLPASETEHRAAFDEAVARATASRKELFPALRKAFGTKARVVAGDIKGENAIRTKAEMLDGTWRDVEDIERYRIEAEDAWDDARLPGIIEQLKQTTGGRVKKVENSVNSPQPDGHRGVRVVIEKPNGDPVEFQVMTPLAGKVEDATRNLRGIMGTMGVLHKRGILVGDKLLDFRYAERLSQHLWEAVTDEIRLRRGGPAPSSTRDALNRFRVDMWGQLTDPLLSRGLSLRSVMGDTFMPLRKANGAKFNRAANNGRGSMEGGPSLLALDDALAREGKMAPIYYPLINADEIPKRGAFLLRGKSGTAMVSDRHLKRNTGKLLDADTYSKDFRRVWEIRAARSARMQQSMDMLFDTVAEYGYKLGPNEALPEGFEAFSPGLMKRLAAQHESFLDSLADDPSGRGLRDLLTEVSGENAQKMLDDLANGGDVEVWAVPQFVAQRLRAHSGYRPIAEHAPGLDMTFRTLSDMWRTITLAYSPRWAINNQLSNALFTKIQGGKLSGVIRQGLDPKYRRALNEAMDTLSPENRLAIEGRGLYGTSARTPRDYSGDGIGNRVAFFMQRNIGQSRAGVAISKPGEWLRRLNQAGEAAFRRESAITAAERLAGMQRLDKVGRSFLASKKRLEHVMRAGLDQDEFNKVADEVNKYFNDYDTMTPLERNIIRPYLAPFEAFYKHAAKLVLTMPFEHPAKARLFALVAEADEERMRHEGLDPEMLPGWLREDMLLTGRGEAGDYRFLSGGGMNPFNGVLSNPLNMAHPLWKVAYEQGTGRSTYTGDKFTDPSVQEVFGTGQQFRFNKQGEPVAIGSTRPGIIEHLLQQVPQYDLVKDAVAGGKTYDTSTLLDVILDPEGNTVMNQETGEPWSKTDALATLAKLFGWSERDYDAIKMQESLLKQQEAALKAYQEARPTTPSSTGGSGSPLGGS